jgi:C_GCAxxG_C_C family probable redox protein
MTTEEDDAGALALACWQNGLFCAESVAVALARAQGMETPLLPALATGLCGGMGHTGGPCGALTGAVLGLGLAFGRDGPGQAAAPTYAAVNTLVERFRAEFGASSCTALLGCDLGTPEGRQTFREQGLRQRCERFTARAAALAGEIIAASSTKPG